MPEITLYGIHNCDTVKKARRWLDEQRIAYRFVDFRETSLTKSRLLAWTKQADWQQLLNTRSRTWRELPAADKQSVDAGKAIDLMLAHVTLIKRPVLEYPHGILVGFDAKTYAKLR